MLTDYHLHLRPDELDATAGRVLHRRERRALPGRGAERPGSRSSGVSEHVHRFTQALEHLGPPVLAPARGATTSTPTASSSARRPLRLGIECDFVPGARGPDRHLLDAHDFDYVVGSVHFLGDGAVDDAATTSGSRDGDPDRLWRRYFETLAEAARSGLFDILAHPDLVKSGVTTARGRERDPRFHYEPAVEAIAESGIAVEVSTAGLRKPVGEIYPAPAFAEMCVEAGAAFALSSDAHVPERRRLRLRPRARDDARLGGRPRSPSSSAASAACEQLG